MRRLFRGLLIAVSLFAGHPLVHAQWIETGPAAYLPVSACVGTGSVVMVQTGQGLYVSTDQGNQWSLSSIGGQVSRFAVAPTSGGTGERFFAVSDRVYSSVDNGTHWTPIDTGLHLPWSAGVSALAATATDVFVGTSFDDGVYRTTDNGASWTSANQGLTNLFIADLAAFPRADGTGTDLFLKTGEYWDTSGTHPAGLFRSTNAGQNWIPVEVGAENLGSAVRSLADVNGNILIGTNSSGIWLSTDRGATWSPTSLTNGTVTCFAVVHVNGGADSVLVAGGDPGVFRSTDGGKNWTSYDFGRWVDGLVASGTNLIAITNGYGPYISSDGGETWRELTSLSGFSQIGATCIATSPNRAGGTTVYAGTFSGIYVSSDNGVSWTNFEAVSLPQENINALAVSIRESRDTTVFAATYNGIFRSTDGGATWAHADSGLTNLYVWALAASADGDSTLVASTFQGDVFLSVDNGSTWHPAGFANDATGQVAICGRNIFAQSDSLGICRSTDGGKSWTPISSAFMESTRAMSNWYYVNPTGIHGRELFAGVGSATVQGVFRSTDDGLTWTMQNGYPLYSSAFTISGSDYFLVDGFRCYISTDHGTYWRHITPDIPEQVWVSGLVVSGPNVILSTYGTIYRQDMTQIITSTESPTQAKPTLFRLEQNYPNPFNPRTVISGQWTADSWVRLEVYDVLGRKVATLADGRYPAGRYSFTFDGTAVASGVYFCRLTAGTYTAVRKMVSVR